MTASELPTGMDVVIAENREVEDSNKSDKIVVIHHMWQTCRPSSKFSSKTPTVTARRIQLVRLKLQNNPRLLETSETEIGTVHEPTEKEEGEYVPYSSPSEYSGISSKKAISDKSFPDSGEFHAYESDTSQKNPSPFPMDLTYSIHNSMNQLKSKISDKESPYSGEAPYPAKITCSTPKKPSCCSANHFSSSTYIISPSQKSPLYLTVDAPSSISHCSSYKRPSDKSTSIPEPKSSAEQSSHSSRKTPMPDLSVYSMEAPEELKCSRQSSPRSPAWPKPELSPIQHSNVFSSEWVLNSQEEEEYYGESEIPLEEDGQEEENCQHEEDDEDDDDVDDDDDHHHHHHRDHDHIHSNETNSDFMEGKSDDHGQEERDYESHRY